MSSSTLTGAASPPRRGWISGTKLTALFALVLGAKFCVMRACSTPLPFFDQWEGEGHYILQRWLHGEWRWTDLFTFHVQHRIALTRLLVLGLFQANGGQWDTQVEMIAAATLHALVAVALGAILIRRLGPASEDKLLLALALTFGLPFGWENTLSGGFQSQFYFLLGLSVLTIWGLGSHRPYSPAWWTGVGAAVVAWGSMAAAPFAPLAVAGAVAVRRWRPAGRETPSDVRADAATLCVALALFAAGVCVNLGINPAANLQPRTLGELAAKFLGLLGWPLPTPWAAPLMYAPWGFLLARRLRQPGRAMHRADDFLLALGMFALLQAAALAYARNQYRGLTVSRYMDLLSIGAFVNFACLLRLSAEAAGAFSGRKRAWLRALGAGWVMLWTLGLAGLTAHNLDVDLPFMRSTNALEKTNLADLLAHPDPAFLKGSHALEFQCEQPGLLLALLRDPLVRDMLPTVARAPLPILPAAAVGRLRPMFEDTPTPVPQPLPTGWTLAPPLAGVPATVFRGRTISRSLPYLLFAVRGEISPSAQLGLVGERTGLTEWILPPEDAVAGEWWLAQVRAPSEPFHVAARVTAGAAGGLEFLCPREAGWLSVWVDPVLGGGYGLLLAGAGLWLAAAFAAGLPAGDVGPRPGRRDTPRRAPAHNEKTESLAEALA